MPSCDLLASLVFSFPELLARHVYNYCTSGQSTDKKNNKTSRSKQRAPVGGAQFVGLELYKRVKEFLQAYLLGLLGVRVDISYLAR